MQSWCLFMLQKILLMLTLIKEIHSLWSWENVLHLIQSYLICTMSVLYDIKGVKNAHNSLMNDLWHTIPKENSDMYCTLQLNKVQTYECKACSYIAETGTHLVFENVSKYLYLEVSQSNIVFVKTISFRHFHMMSFFFLLLF